MTVSVLEGIRYSFSYFARLRLPSTCRFRISLVCSCEYTSIVLTKSYGGDSRSSVELECLHGCHGCRFFVETANRHTQLLESNGFVQKQNVGAIQPKCRTIHEIGLVRICPTEYVRCLQTPMIGGSFARLYRFGKLTCCACQVRTSTPKIANILTSHERMLRCSPIQFTQNDSSIARFWRAQVVHDIELRRRKR